MAGHLKAAAQLAPTPTGSMVGQMICTDRRWTEPCRVGSQSAEPTPLGPITAHIGVVPRWLD